MTKGHLKFLKVLILSTIFSKHVLFELEEEKDNPIIAELLEAATAVYNAQRSSQLIKGEGQAAKIQSSKIEMQIKEARKIVKGINLEGLE